MACSISDHLIHLNALDLPFLRIVVGSQDGEVRTCHAQKAYIAPNELEVEIDLAGGGRHTSVCNALNGSVDEGGSSSIWIQIDDVNPVALRGMRVHQNAGKKIHQASITLAAIRKANIHRASPSFTRTFPGPGRSVPSGPGPLSSMAVPPPKPFSSTFRVIAAVAAGDRSFAITYLWELT